MEDINMEDLNMDINEEDDETTRIGKILEKEYGGSSPQDLHIEYFFTLLGKEIRDRQADIIVELRRLDVWENLETEWPELMFSTRKFLKTSPNETERHREERLNQIRIQLLTLFADPKDPNDPNKIIPHIIVGRACKYYKEVSTHSLSTPEMENILTIPACNDQHLDYFYLVIKLNKIASNVVMDVPSMLAACPGDWREVKPKITWPLTFIGHFPKKPFETEREREWRLNKEVRLPLKEHLEGLLIQFQGVAKPEKLAIILFTRACKYTNM